MKRREFVRNTALAGALGASLPIVYSHLAPKGYTFILDQDPDPYKLFGKDQEMRLLNDKPWNMEAAAHLLDDPITPNKFMFIRNNGLIPDEIDVANWVLTIDGESVRETKTFSLDDLKTKFPLYTYQLTLECGGNGRSEFDPPAKAINGRLELFPAHNGQEPDSVTSSKRQVLKVMPSMSPIMVQMCTSAGIQPKSRSPEGFPLPKPCRMKPSSLTK